MTEAEKEVVKQAETPVGESNKLLRAVALQYRDSEQLPKVITSGVAEVAEKIVALAKANGIPITQDDSLSEMLAKIPAGAVIPQESFRLVAEIVSFLYHCDKEWREKNPELAKR